MKSHKLSFILLSLIAVLILTFCTEDSTNPPEEELNDITNPPGGYINKLAINPEGDFFAGTTFGLYISSDKGSSWNSLTHMINSVLDVFDVLLLSNEEIFILCNDSHSLYSSDNGSSWTTISTSMNYVNSISKNQTGNVFFCGDGLYSTSDKGITWTEIFNESVYNICSPDDSIMVIGVPGIFVGQILYSTDSGISWNSTSCNANVLEFYEFNNTLFAGGGFSVEGGGGVYKSTDEGIHWESCGLDQTTVSSFVNNKQNDLFIGTSEGIYFTEDEGETWQNVLADSSVTTLMKDEKGFLYAGTMFGTFLRSTDNGMTWHN